MKLQRKHINIITYTIICLMISISIVSIFGDGSLSLISGDYGHGIFGMNVSFTNRSSNDTNQIDSSTLIKLLNLKNTNIQSVNITANSTIDENRIRHLFRFSHDQDDRGTETNKSLANSTTTIEAITQLPPINYEDDYIFLKTVKVDLKRSRWSYNETINFLQMAPIICEIVAIIWAIMAIVYQSNPKYYSGLPKPWRIVVPSIIVFFLMIVLTIFYIVIYNMYLNEFCDNLKRFLHHKDVFSCGLVMSALRASRISHNFTLETHLKIFETMTYLTLGFWLIAFLITVFRFIFVIDFQLSDGHAANPANYKIIPTIEISPSTESAISSVKSAKELTEDDDFYSVESNL